MMKSRPPQPALLPLATDVAAAEAEATARRTSASHAARPSDVADALLAARLSRAAANKAARQAATASYEASQRRQSDAYWAGRAAAKRGEGGGGAQRRAALELLLLRGYVMGTCQRDSFFFCLVGPLDARGGEQGKVERETSGGATAPRRGPTLVSRFDGGGGRGGGRGVGRRRGRRRPPGLGWPPARDRVQGREEGAPDGPRRPA